MGTPRDRGRTAESALKRSSRQRIALRMYIAGTHPRSIRALRTVMDVCQTHLQGRYHLEVIDVYQDPERARADQIIALPTLVRCAPPPAQRFVGDLSDPMRVLRALGLLVNLDAYAKANHTTTKLPRR